MILFLGIHDKCLRLSATRVGFEEVGGCGGVLSVVERAQTVNEESSSSFVFVMRDATNAVIRSCLNRGHQLFFLFFQRIFWRLWRERIDIPTYLSPIL